ncbi:InlB B-repeat-containing protein [Gardnerella swidsinskii]|uniref:InlB B-repeat-containing protein n=1 Tax=Gardnerella swidsinskii TaxID=2792979 RepID=UPI0025505F45|nr:InlB B-repeat-containing protein [Gardnerella swidsinskii]MDK8692257.1 InlB B-repeat-containing protein [Gardnerella swidsinskii]
MNNKIIKKVISLAVAFVATIGLFAGTVTAQAADKGTAEVKKYPLSLDMDIALDPGYGHTHPGGKGQIDKNIESMWENLPITVEDENGKKIDVKKNLQSNFQRFVGDFAIGEKLTITIDTDKIPVGYHLSHDTDRTYIPAKGYSKFTVTYKLDDGKPIPLRISFGKLNVKFDLKGGNIEGKTDPIVNTVKTDNTVDFPADPAKKNLVFGGWYTELPDIEYYQNHNMAGKRYYWNKKSLFSDTSCDVPQWNDEKLDPRGDYQFLLRAQWNAKVSFNANGGTFIDGKAEKSGAIRQGKSIKMLAAPTREDYQFLNWVDAAGKTYKPGEEYTLNANTVFTAKWKQIRSTVTFKNGDKTQTVKVETGKAIDTDALKDQSMPKNPTKDGYTFKEWNTKADGKGKAFTGTTLVNSDLTVYAIFTKNLKSAPTPDPILPAPFEPESGMENPLSVPESQTPETKQELSHAPKSEHEHNTAHEYVKSPIVEHKTEKHVPDMPKTGESASVVALISALGFAIAGFAVVRLRRVFEAKSVR